MVSSINGVGKNRLTCKIMTLRLHRKINSNASDLNVRPKSIKPLEKNIGDQLWHWCWWIFGSDSKSKGNKTKNKQVGLHQTKKLLHSKRNHPQNEDNILNGRKYFQIIYPVRG